MTPFQNLPLGAPLPPADPDDLKRVWRFSQTKTDELRAHAGADAEKGCIGIDGRLVLEQCSPGADVQAVFFRAQILQFLLGRGFLDEWREGGDLRDIVFQVAASFPITLGDQGFDVQGLIDRLRAG